MNIPLSDYTTGATVASDLVNTSPTVRVTTGDALPDTAALARFLAEHDVRLDAPPPTDDDLRLVHVLRMQIRVILETETEEHAVAGASVLVRRAALAPVLHRDDDGRWQWHVPTAPGAPLADELAALVGVGLFGVVRTLGRERFRSCAAPGCRGVFVDTSRAGKRRYCMPDLCGNRLNVANHRARRRLGSVAR
ncbi:CGNR zinc finger domain-containing protein [Actinomadura sp. NPDC047616]|uniref:CGNR zinc finger domain-containing protein n=1 Tax=Actinomadura sp. NPDC047616 TaxID=3155914 RepID=UPI0033E48869